MTQINTEHLKKVQVICNTELEMKATEEFLKSFNMAGMKPIMLECEIEDFVPSKDHNYALADFGNLEYSTRVYNRFQELKIALKVFEI